MGQLKRFVAEAYFLIDFAIHRLLTKLTLKRILTNFAGSFWISQWPQQQSSGEAVLQVC